MMLGICLYTVKCGFYTLALRRHVGAFESLQACQSKMAIYSRISNVDEDAVTGVLSRFLSVFCKLLQIICNKICNKPLDK